MANDTDVRVGTFEVVSGKLFVSDPCYRKDTWCAGTLTGVLNGTWISRIEMETYTLFGDRESRKSTRVGKLIAYHKDCRNRRSPDLEFFKNLGVDSGQMSIQDFDKTPEDPGNYSDEGSHYRLACDRGASEDDDAFDENRPKAFIFTPHAVVSDSGYGDGSYPCYVGANADGVIDYVEIDFMGEPEDDEETDDSEEE